MTITACTYPWCQQPQPHDGHQHADGPTGLRPHYARALGTGALTTEDLDRLVLREGRCAGPGLLAAAYAAGKIEDSTVASLIGGIWSGAEYPDRELDRADWSWTADRTTAERFAAGAGGRPAGRIYTLLAPPESLLCANNCRSESEYVVDTRGLDIREVSL